MRTKTVMATMFNVKENVEDVQNPMPAGTQIQCEIRVNACGKPMVYCFANGEHIGCFAMKGSIGFTMLRNSIYFGEEVMAKMPQKFKAKVVSNGVINPGRVKVAYLVEVEVPEDLEVTLAEEEYPNIAAKNPSNGCGSANWRAGCGTFYSIVNQLPNMSSDDLITLRHRIDKELAAR